MRTENYLYIKNFKPERWPAGAPEKYGKDGQLEPGFHDIDQFTERFTYINREDLEIRTYFDLAVARRPLEELYQIKKDPGCLENLAGKEEFKDILMDHRNRLDERLLATKDPRVMGNGDIWEEYIRFSPIRDFPEPDWKTD
jgi:uncharacterized sulfatase